MKRRITALFAATLMALSMLAVPAMANGHGNAPANNCVGELVSWDAQFFGPNGEFGPNSDSQFSADAPGIGNLVNELFDGSVSVQTYMKNFVGVGSACS